jgi:hypothetical protein
MSKQEIRISISALGVAKLTAHSRKESNQRPFVYQVHYLEDSNLKKIPKHIISNVTEQKRG